MTPEDLDPALAQKPRPQPAPLLPAQVQPLSSAIGCSDQDAWQMAIAKNLIDDQGQLYCWNCNGQCPWHVSLHCQGCRERSIAMAPERRRVEREKERARQAEQSRDHQPSTVRQRAFR